MVKLVREFETLPYSNMAALDSLTAAHNHIIHYNMVTFNCD
jgi:hypothetical protein